MQVVGDLPRVFLFASADSSPAEIRKRFQFYFRDWANEHVHVRQAARGGTTSIRFNQPHVVKFAKILAVPDFHFALNDCRHLFFASMFGASTITWI